MTGLDPQQKAIVVSPLGPLLVVAGAGTGKTRTLTHRVAHWLGEGLDPSRVLLVTFTQRAAGEMGSRVAALNGCVPLEWAGTFHAVAARLLRDYAPSFGYRPDFRIIDPARSARLLGDVIRANQYFANRPGCTPEGLLKAHSLAVNADRSLADVIKKVPHWSQESHEQVDDILVEYLVSKIERNVMDYDDLLLYWHQLLASEDPLADELISRFDAVFVDEYQDVNPLQVRLLDRMASAHRRLTAVGDDRQSIYGFRGADLGAMLRFEERYPDARTLHLSTNYRSTPEIVELANCSIGHNRTGHRNPLCSGRRSGPRPQYHSLRTSRAQAEFLGHQILRLNAEGVPFKEQAILYRTHAQGRAVELLLGEMGVPYTVRSGRRLFERPHVRPMFDLLGAISQPDNPHTWGPALALFDGLGPVACATLTEELSQLGGLQEWSFRDGNSNFMPARFRDSTESARRALGRFYELGQTSVTAVVQTVVTELMASWIQKKYPQDADQRIADLNELTHVAARFSTLEGFLDALALASDDGPDDDAVVLSTIHRAKGLEWAAVFIIGLFEGGFPLGATFGDPSGLDEERRLFYVAMTRSQRWLYLAHAWQDRSDGPTQMPSRFLSEILDAGRGLLDTFTTAETES